MYFVYFLQVAYPKASYMVSLNDDGSSTCFGAPISAQDWFSEDFLYQDGACLAVGEETIACGIKMSQTVSLFKCPYYGVQSTFYILKNVEPAVLCKVHFPALSGAWNYTLHSWANDALFTWPDSSTYTVLPQSCHNKV